MQEQLVTGVNLNNRSYFANSMDFLHFPRNTVCPKQQKSSHPEKSLQKVTFAKFNPREKLGKIS